MATPLVKVSYKNVSGSAVPPHGVIQFTGAPVVTATGDYVLQATTPGSGTGPYFIDDGKGASASGAGQFGSCFKASEGFCWASYTASAPAAWAEIGPDSGSFHMITGGSGYFYADTIDTTNHRILVTAKPSGGLSTYLVTQLSSGANAAIYRDPVLSFGANPSYPTFLAQPWDPASTTTLAAIDHSKDVAVSSTCLTGTLFTGQVFAVSVGATKIALGGDGIQFPGTVASVGSGVVTVTIPYLSNITTTQTASIVATNDTGITLTVGQSVIVEQINIVGSTTSRYRVAEFKC